MSATGDTPTSHKWWATMMNKSCKWGHSSYNSVHIPVINPNFVNKWPIFSGDWGHQPDYICPKTVMVVSKCSIWEAHWKSKPLFPRENHLPRVSFHTQPAAEHLEQSSLVNGMGFEPWPGSVAPGHFWGPCHMSNRPNTWLLDGYVTLHVVKQLAQNPSEIGGNHLTFCYLAWRISDGTWGFKTAKIFVLALKRDNANCKLLLQCPTPLWLMAY